MAIRFHHVERSEASQCIKQVPSASPQDDGGSGQYDTPTKREQKIACSFLVDLASGKMALLTFAKGGKPRSHPHLSLLTGDG